MARALKSNRNLKLKVGVVSPYRTVVPHYETELDIVQQHLDQGDSVVLLDCTGQLPNCEFNVSKDPEICANCRGRREMGMELLSISPEANRPAIVQETFDWQSQAPDLQTTFQSVDELINYTLDGFDLGYAALSSLVSYCRDPEPDLQYHAPTLALFVRSGWQTYQQTLAWLDRHQFDRVYVYNGRFAAMRGAFRACQRRQVDCYLHERGCDEGHFELLKNHLPHDLQKIHQTIEQGWLAAADSPDRESIAASWFQERLERVEKVWHSFTKEQQRGRLPHDWNPDARNISIFCSSDDEFVAIGDAWKNDLYPNQVTAIERIVSDLQQLQPDTQLYLRMHPNLKGVENDRVRRMRELKSPNLTVLPPEDEVDTYQLLRDSDTVVTFGSSVGSEAVYWGTPSVLLGPCFYQDLGGVYRSDSHSQTLELLTNHLAPGDREGALKYGYWFQTRGVPHQYFQASGLFEGTFKEQVVYARPAPKPKRWKRVLRSLVGDRN